MSPFPSPSQSPSQVSSNAASHARSGAPSAPSLLPLRGVKVVDFGQYIAGPAVAMILGDLGATVVHVDPPGGPLWDSPANATLMRNKLIVEIDLKTPEGWNRRWS